MSATIVHHLITLCLVWVLIGSLVWMVVFSSGRLGSMYDEPSGSGAVIDGFANILITVVLIIGWPGMLGMLAALDLHQRRARR
ncbi:MAG: hypothetical protein QHD01_31630 [Bradyrhizobium sp.]|uniref:hypothetical protein n=1 Tax=Bradyrhizobium sp. TaxID=376 RepID=UPI0029BC8947|nr:hypothetical protein [Bradyrhizobium sp.]MDX3971120.1 hypothetical protein [Bradyrhizobium sp.]